jgi:hypothetical protein
MHADPDTLCAVVYCTAADLLPEARANARRRITDAEIVTLCVAQAIMGIPSDRRFLATARKQLVHLFPELPRQAGYHKRRRRLADAIEWLMAHFAAQSPGAADNLLLIDSTPVECARSRETVKRSALAELADYGYCASHSRWFRGFRLHLLAAPDGTPRSGRWAPSSCARRVRMRPAAVPTWPPSVSASSRSSGASRARSPWSATGRTMAGLRERILARWLRLAACISLNHRLGRPSRALADYCA